MAGESPDRSKQRESSAEPTSGSAGPVPEARNSAGKRDPRLAVAREASPSGSRTGGDTATRVLSVREATEDGATADDAPAGGRDVSAGEGDGRLREAVASWVRPAGPGGGATAEDGSDAGTGTGNGAEDASAQAAPAAGESRTEAEAESVDTDTDTDAGEGASDVREAGVDGPSRKGTAGEGEAGSEDAVREAPEDDPVQDAADGAEDARDAEDAEDTGNEAPAGTATSAVTDADDADDTAREEAGDGSAAEDGDEPRGGGVPAATKDADGAPGADAAGDDDAAPGTDPSSGSPKAAPAVPAAGADDDPESGDDPEADDASTGTGTGDDPEAGPEAEDKAGPEDGAKNEAEAEPGPEAGAKGPVDQPTAVFRTGRPSAPPVDQPTTMLKLGDAGAKTGPGGADAAQDGEDGTGTDTASGPKAGPRTTPKAGPRTNPKSGPRTNPKSGPASGPKTGPEAGPEAGPGSESDAERTSKFVALKEFDDPGVRKPARGGDATTALRTVTPAAKPPVPADATASVPQVGPERTTQQPLPPKPPLDLLAELTNTPPPPETPLRTAVRRIKIWTPLVLLLVIVFAVVQNVRPLPAPTLELTAQDSYTFEGGKVDIPWPASGQAALDVQGIGTFGSSGEQKPVPIASVAKVMTAYLVLRDHPLKSGAEGPMIKIDETAEKQADAVNESTVKVTAGDEISQREAVEAVLIASANNVARLVARWDAGSEEAFVAKMNEAAKDLGMTDTTYTDPSGLNNTTVSTAVDQVKLAKAAMQQPVFREVAAMMSYDDYKGRNHPNWNQLVGSNGVVGIKTGTTTSALGNLVFAAKKEVDGETRLIIGAVVRQPAGGKDNTILSAALTSSDRLIRAAQGALESATILKKGTVVGYVDDGLGGRTPVAVTEDVKAVGWAGLSVKLTFAAGDDLPHRAEAGTEVGTLTVGDGTSSAVKVPVALQEDLVEPGFTDKLTRIS